MRELFLVLIPLAGACFAALWPSERTRPWFLPIISAIHTLLMSWLLINPPEVLFHSWMGFDPLARAILPVISLLFLVCSIYGIPYLKIHKERKNRVFVSVILASLGLISAAHMSRHLGLLWIATEGLTLCFVPLIHFSSKPRAIEATWKYLLVSATGIALSLLGSFCLGYASLHGGGKGDLTFTALIAQASSLSRPWVLIAWVLILVGYGTKMGLVPMHAWKPDAYGEAPSMAGALLAGGVSSVAFLALLRVRSVVAAAGAGVIADRTLLFLGLLSMVLAAFFLLSTNNFKRMLAYSSIEQMGILCIGASLGAVGLWAAFFHLWNNCMAKGAIFLSAGNLQRGAGSCTTADAKGLFLIMPHSSLLFMAGLFAITACPPFGLFFSELMIIKNAFFSGYPWVAVLFLFALMLAFFGLTRIVFSVVHGRPKTNSKQLCTKYCEKPATLLPSLILIGAVLFLGLCIPNPLRQIWSDAVQQLIPNL